MDPVSKLLEERQVRGPRWRLLWVIAAVALHAAVGAAVVLLSVKREPVVVHYPTVSVRLVRLPPRPKTTGKTSGGKPSVAVRQDKPKPKRAEKTTKSTEKKSSTDAMPALKSKRSRHPKPATASQGAGGESGLQGVGARGLSLSSAGGGGAALPEDFRFTYWVQRMLALIQSKWYKPPVPPGTKARVRFVVARDGRVSSIVLEEASGIPAFDRAALRALYAANPLPPLPPAYHKDSLTIHLTFSEER